MTHWTSPGFDLNSPQLQLFLFVDPSAFSRAEVPAVVRGAVLRNQPFAAVFAATDSWHMSTFQPEVPKIPRSQGRLLVEAAAWEWRVSLFPKTDRFVHRHLNA